MLCFILLIPVIITSYRSSSGLTFYQEKTLSVDVQTEQQKKKKMTQQDRSQETSQCAQFIRDNLPEERVRLMDVACEEGLCHGYLLFPYTVIDSGMFQNALHICYGWRPSDLPGTCVCGSSFHCYSYFELPLWWIFNSPS